MSSIVSELVCYVADLAAKANNTMRSPCTSSLDAFTTRAVAGWRLGISALAVLMLTGCGLIDMPTDDPPEYARIELQGNTNAEVEVIFSSVLAPTQDGDPVMLAADTLVSALPVSRTYTMHNPEFFLKLTRLDPGDDDLEVRVWAGDLLFVDNPALPDTQATVRVVYRYRDYSF